MGKQVTQREIDLAIETVVRGYGFQRSFTHPYLFEKVDGLWRMYDEPRKKGGERREEFISHRMDPTDVPDEAERVVVTVSVTYIGGREMADPTKTLEANGGQP